MVINSPFKKLPLFTNDIIIYKRTGKKKTLKTKRDYTKVVKTGLIHKNPFLSCMLTMNNWNLKLRT